MVQLCSTKEHNELVNKHMNMKNNKHRWNKHGRCFPTSENYSCFQTCTGLRSSSLFCIRCAYMNANVRVTFRCYCGIICLISLYKVRRSPGEVDIWTQRWIHSWIQHERVGDKETKRKQISASEKAVTQTTKIDTKRVWGIRSEDSVGELHAWSFPASANCTWLLHLSPE